MDPPLVNNIAAAPPPPPSMLVQCCVLTAMLVLFPPVYHTSLLGRGQMPAGDPDWAIEDPRYRSKAYRQHVDTSEYKIVDDAFAGGGYGPRCWNDDMETVSPCVQ